MTLRRALFILAAVASIVAPARGQQIGPGDGEHTATLLDVTFRIATYRPPNCAPRLLVAAFHGNDRDGGPTRSVSGEIARTYCAIIVAPRFDKQRFSDVDYSLGRVVDKGALVPPGTRTVDFVAPLIAWARAASGQPNLPVALIGHSGGGQLVDRVAAYVPTDARRFVVANPSTWVLPTLEPAPYGFGGIGTPAEGDKAIRAYLALPLVVLLGGKDTGDGALANNREAVAQGANRLERGRNTFALAETVARERKWAFGWKKLEVPNSGHNVSTMFDSRQAVEAFR